MVSAAGDLREVAGSTETVLYDIDARYDTLVSQTPANDGTLSTVGALGFNVTGSVAFDIVLFPQAGVLTNVGLLAANINDSGNATLLQVNLSTGRASAFATISGETIVGMAATVR